MAYIIHPWLEIEWEPANIGLLHIGLAYMNKRPLKWTGPDGEPHTMPGEHQLQIGILIGRIVIHFNY